MNYLIDLHCHLDGSLDLETSFKLAKSRNIINEDLQFEEFKNRMVVRSDTSNLEEFLSCFQLPLSLLQDKEALTKSTIDAIKNLNEDNIMYAELRFAPQLHTQKNLSQEEVVEAVLEGVKEAKEIYTDIKVNIILCMMRGITASDTNVANIKTIKVAKQYLDKGVVAIDLAGSEKNDFLEYKVLFDYARQLNIPFVIHAGENNYPNNVSLAIDYGAKRIGHGIHAIEDKDILNKLVNSKIPLEVCVTSNIQCQLQPSFEKHSIRQLYDNNVNITLNTDNRTLSNTTLQKEIKKIKEYLNFTNDDIRQMMINAINSAFISTKEKEEFTKKLMNSSL